MPAAKDYSTLFTPIACATITVRFHDTIKAIKAMNFINCNSVHPKQQQKAIIKHSSGVYSESSSSVA